MGCRHIFHPNKRKIVNDGCTVAVINSNEHPNRRRTGESATKWHILAMKTIFSDLMHFNFAPFDS